MPLREMKRWLQNKPAGFGEGKTYDTTAEEKILEEFQQSMKNQKAKKGRLQAGSGGKQEKQKVTDAIRSDTEVRVGNLPKKRNVDRDLWKAFKEFRGITSISPAVTGSKKTRDPVCRGFAFVGFESGDAAHRFVQTYSKQNLLFGKIQKQISCDIVNGNSAFKSQYSSDGTTSLDVAEHMDEESMPSALEISEGSTQSKEGSEAAKQNMEDSSVLPTSERAMEFENSSLSYSDFVEVEHEAVINHLPSNSPVSSDHNRKMIATKKGKIKPTKSSKLRVPGSLARLKIKERAVLTGAFSKYGEVVSSTPSAPSQGVR